MEGLTQAKKVLSQIMRLKTSKMLFNEPVDPVALGLDDYFDKVEQPMDFGTIMDQLQQGATKYKNPSEVLRDVNLVFQNCFTYNDSEADTVTRELCAEVQSTFNKRWTDAGLSLDLKENFSRETAHSPAKPASNGVIAWRAEALVPPELSYEEGVSISLNFWVLNLRYMLNFLFAVYQSHSEELLFSYSKTVIISMMRCTSCSAAFICCPMFQGTSIQRLCISWILGCCTKGSADCLLPERRLAASFLQVEAYDAETCVSHGQRERSCPFAILTAFNCAPRAIPASWCPWRTRKAVQMRS